VLVDREIQHKPVTDEMQYVAGCWLCQRACEGGWRYLTASTLDCTQYIFCLIVAEYTPGSPWST
jgi:hypothetical protein